MPIRVLIRADAGKALGTGHFARARAVAEALSAGGSSEIMLATNQNGAPLAPSFFPKNLPILTLAPSAAGAAGTMQALGRLGWAPNAIYLDQYGEVPEWERQAADAGIPLLVVDDLDAANRAEIIVRPHGGDGDAEGIVLRGPAYVPLSRHVTDLAGQAQSRVKRGRLKLNVCFGGTDPTGETAKAVQALTELDDIDADVVIGPGASIDPALIAVAECLPQVTLHRAPSPEKLAELMSTADLGLGAGGVMLWERLCLGLPSLVVAAAANQRPQIDAMATAGAIRFLGDHDEVDAGTISKAITEFAADGRARRDLARAGQELVDGRGAVRLAGWIKALALDARDVRLDDARDLFEWRTDERNWRNNWEPADRPDFGSHQAWLETKLAGADCVFRILVLDEEPVGVVRFDLGDAGRSAYLSIYLVPVWHGRKMGLSVLLAAERALRRSHPGVRVIVSRIHRDNRASERLHRDASFEVTPSTERDDWLDARKSID